MQKLIIFNDYINYGEEMELIPGQTIYLKGCNINCQFCSVIDTLNDPDAGTEVSIDELVDSILQAKENGAMNVNFVGGEPSVFIKPLLEVMSKIKGKQKIIWNSNMYFEEKTLVILNEFVDVYLADLKFGNDTCAMNIAGAKRYSEIVKNNIMKAAAVKDTIIRHLVLPGHIECCTQPVLEWIENNLSPLRAVRDHFRTRRVSRTRGKKLNTVDSRLKISGMTSEECLCSNYDISCKVSLMTNFTPNYKARDNALNHFLSDEEIESVKKLKTIYKLNYIE